MHLEQDMRYRPKDVCIDLVSIAFDLNNDLRIKETIITHMH